MDSVAALLQFFRVYFHGLDVSLDLLNVTFESFQCFFGLPVLILDSCEQLVCGLIMFTVHKASETAKATVDVVV